MNKIQLRRKRKKLKAEQVEILQQIDRLQKVLTIEKDRKKHQGIKKEINRLGELLEQKVAVKVTDHSFVDSNEEYQEYARSKKAPWSMPLDKYVGLKRNGHTDKEIAQMEGVEEIQIRKWKSRNGVTRESWMKEAN